MKKQVTIDITEIQDKVSLIKAIKNGKDLISEFIRNSLDSETKFLLNDYYENVDSEKLIEKLLITLNSFILDEDFFDKVAEKIHIVWDEKASCLLKNMQDNQDFLAKHVIMGIYPKSFYGDDIDYGAHLVHIDKILYTPSFGLGPRMSYSMMNDPKHILFVLARYKFCSKILSGSGNILEMGCGDAFGSAIVGQTVDKLHCIDIEPHLIRDNNMRYNRYKKRFGAFLNIEFSNMDMINTIPDRKYDALYAIDVWEHLSPETEDIILDNVCKCLKKNSKIIIGTPNIEAAKYASEPGASPHVNLKSHKTLKQLLDKKFETSMIFSMNDEIVHTGFDKMAHYLFGIGITLK